MARIFKITSAVILIVSIYSAAAFTEDYMQVQAAIDISTVVSDGRYTLSQIADIARKNDIRIIIPADGFLNRWEYGLWPFRNIIKKVMTTNSVSLFGIRRYLNLVRTAQRKNMDMIFLNAVEAGPFYYWEGSPFGNSFSIKNWHKHLLVIGLDNAKDYRGLPMIGNGLSLAKPFGIMSLLFFLAMAGILSIGLLFVKMGSFAQQAVYERRFGLLLRHWKYIGILLVVSSLGLLVNNFPYCRFEYDQYHGDLGASPYQKMIDYVNSRGGATFWEHPEAKNVEKLGNVSIETDEHADYLLSTYGYTGYAIFYEGYDRIGAPERIWDAALKDYCLGIRPLPVWAIGAMDFEKAGNLEQCMTNLRTVFLLSHFTKADALNALKEGRMYVSREKEAANFVLDAFTVKDPSTGIEKIMGQELTVAGKPHITIAGHFSNKSSKNVKITIIRGGEIMRVMDATAPFSIGFDDDDNVKAAKSYYRLEIRAEGLLSVTNPIFVKRK
ncbi:MAG: hypothetical protein KKE81_02275 [Candidatus Omnitrophica bacterium]|nr:hypothetical protein [Candidatus Omnitrophota bacterium]